MFDDPRRRHAVLIPFADHNHQSAPPPRGAAPGAADALRRMTSGSGARRGPAQAEAPMWAALSDRSRAATRQLTGREQMAQATGPHATPASGRPLHATAGAPDVGSCSSTNTPRSLAWRKGLARGWSAISDSSRGGTRARRRIASSALTLPLTHSAASSRGASNSANALVVAHCPALAPQPNGKLRPGLRRRNKRQLRASSVINRQRRIPPDQTTRAIWR
jgi:hypothetical protein